MSGQGAAEAIVEICRRLAARGFVAATDGNVSARLPNGRFLVTRTSVHKGLVTAGDLVEVDASGVPVDKGAAPTTELGMHLYIYSQRPDAGAVVHAHPPYATGFATARRSLAGCLFPEVITGLGAIPLAEYATPATTEVARSLEPYVKTADAVLLTNHGVVVCGKDPWDAYFKLEKVEHAAHVAFVAHLLGGAHPLTPGEVEKLKETHPASADKPACDPAPEGEGGEKHTGEDIRELVRQMMRLS